MLKIKRFFTISIILIFLLFNLCTISYGASVPVTEENLKEAFKELEKFSEGELSISVNNNVITFTAENENYSLNYDLTGEPTFSIEIPEEEIEGMTYQEITKLGENLSNILDLSYIAVAYIQGVDVKDAAEYIIEPLFISANSPMYETMEEIQEEIRSHTEVDPNTNSWTDSNTYTLTMETTETRLVEKLTIHLDGNFNKVKEYAELIRECYGSSENSEEAGKEEEELSSGKVTLNGVTIDIGGLGVDKEENILTPEEQARQVEKAILREMEKEYKAERNKIPNAGDTTMLVLKSITVVSIIALIIVIACSIKRKR